MRILNTSGTCGRWESSGRRGGQHDRSAGYDGACTAWRKRKHRQLPEQRRCFPEGKEAILNIRLSRIEQDYTVHRFPRPAMLAATRPTLVQQRATARVYGHVTPPAPRLRGDAGGKLVAKMERAGESGAAGKATTTNARTDEVRKPRDSNADGVFGRQSPPPRIRDPARRASAEAHGVKRHNDHTMHGVADELLDKRRPYAPRTRQRLAIG